jgi:hypothetical protein
LLAVLVVALLVVGYLVLRPGAGGGGSSGSTVAQLSDRAALVPMRDPTGAFTRLMVFDTTTHDLKPWAGTADSLQGGSTPGTIDRFSATPSPDRTLVAYLEGSQDGLPVPYVANPDGGDAHRLMTSPDAPCANTKRPAWSPDGRRMAVVCVFPDRSWSLWLVDARDGAGIRKLIAKQQDSELGSPTWDAAHHTVYTWRAPPPGDPDAPLGTKGRPVSVADDTDEPTPQQIPGLTDARYTEPDWAPPGLLTVHRAKDGDNQVDVVSGDRVTRVVDGPYQNATWSPDHHSILATVGAAQADLRLVVLPYPQDSSAPQETGVVGNFGAPNWGTR